MSFIWPQYTDFLDHMTLLWAILSLPIGLIILIKGADWLVDGAVAIAKHLGMSPLIIGLTIVAMGTSAPEVAASVESALKDLPGTAVGNVYGSNIANLALVAGLCSIIRPILVSRPAIKRDIPLMLGTALLLYPVFLLCRMVEATGSARYSLYALASNIFMLIVFAGIIVFMIHSERIRSKKDARLMKEQVATVEQAAPHQPKSFWFSVFIIGLGLVCLAEGAKLTVASASIIGARAGMSPLTIGATIVALGTSLPELLTCLIAAFKGHDDLSIGNLVGSNIFNTLLVVSTAGIAKPFSVLTNPEIIGTGYWIMIGVLVLFSVIAFLTKKISRVSGILLSAVYIGFILYNVLGAGSD